MKLVLCICIFIFPTSLFADDFGPLKGFTLGNGKSNAIVILHGDGGPGRYDAFAAQLAKKHRNSTIITLLRPGYKQKTFGAKT